MIHMRFLLFLIASAWVLCVIGGSGVPCARDTLALRT